MEIPLGTKVRDITSGFTGHVTSRTENLTGCIQYYVEPIYDEKTKEIPKGYNIDFDCLEVISSTVVKKLAANKLKLTPKLAAVKGRAKQDKHPQKPS